jgi:hypothetical protein
MLFLNNVCVPASICTLSFFITLHDGATCCGKVTYLYLHNLLCLSLPNYLNRLLILCIFLRNRHQSTHTSPTLPVCGTAQLHYYKGMRPKQVMVLLQAVAFLVALLSSSSLLQDGHMVNAASITCSSTSGQWVSWHNTSLWYYLGAPTTIVSEGPQNADDVIIPSGASIHVVYQLVCIINHTNTPQLE